MVLKVARRGLIPPFIAMDVMAEANAAEAAGADVIHLEVGQPSTGAPAPVLDAARAALAKERLGYTEAFGVPALRARIGAFYGARYGAPVDAARIAVTTGSSGAFIVAFLAAFDAGDRVAFAAPGYPGYRNILTALGIEPVSVPTGPAEGFRLSREALEALDPVPDGLIIASPANPTGAMLDAGALGAIVAWCGERGVRLVSDEIYHGITYDREAVTVAALDPHAIVINSFSKYFSMTGWRLGWAVLPEELSRAVECLSQNLFISPPALSQHAGLAVFDCGPELDGHVARYRANRDILLDGLPGCGFGPLAPADGAFYVYAGIGALGEDSVRLCRAMLAETGVAATPGVDFDAERGRDFVRFSYAGATDDMVEAVRRLKSWSKAS